MKDIVLVALVVIAFAFFVTVHVTIAFGLAKRPPRWHALAAFFFVLPAPYFAWRERMRTRAGLWVGSMLVYVVTLVLASRNA